MMRATAILTGRPVPLEAVKTEEEARAWIAARRNELVVSAST
jgi:hypothetical protein